MTFDFKAGIQELLIDEKDYDTINRLGIGGCGEVFLWKHKVTGQFVAAKRVLQIPRTPRDQQVFLREVIIPLQINIPGIVHLVGWSLPPIEENRGNPLILTEYMPNGSLQNIIVARAKGNPNPNFGPTEYSKAIFGIAATMMHMHSKNIMHRDLKPDNVFIDSDYEIRIADFGLSKMAKDNIQNTNQIGSPVFMAPELVIGDSNPDISIDVYAFAVLMYMMFGNNRFQLDSPNQAPIKKVNQILMQVGRGARFIRKPEIPDHYWELIKKCWDQSPIKRPTFAEIVEILKDDKFAFPNTDLESLHEYQGRMLKIPDDGSQDMLAQLDRLSTCNDGGSGLKASQMIKSIRDPLVKSQMLSTMLVTRNVVKHYDFKKMAYYPPK